MTDGPLIVQSDKTLLLEVDHPDADECRTGDRAVRRARAGPRACPHLPPDPARAVERARRRPRRRAGRRRAAALQPLPGAARAARRRRRDDGALRPAPAALSPTHGLVLASTDRAVLEEVLRAKKIAPLIGVPHRRGHRRGASQRAGRDQAGAAQAGLAGRGPRRLCRRRGPRDRAGRGRLVAAPLPARGRGELLARRLGCGRAALRRRQDDRRRGGDGRGGRDHAHPGHQHRLRPPVAPRAAQAHLADRGRDRRVLRREEGDPAGHHRHLPGDDDPPQGRLQPPRALRRARLGPDPLRRGAPAAGADLPLHRRHPVPAPPRADRDAGARGRPRGRRVLPDRAQALRRAVEGHRGAGLHRAGRLCRGPRHPHRPRANAVRDGRARRALSHRRHDRDQDQGRGAARRAARRRSRRW